MQTRTRQITATFAPETNFEVKTTTAFRHADNVTQSEESVLFGDILVEPKPISVSGGIPFSALND